MRLSTLAIAAVLLVPALAQAQETTVPQHATIINNRSVAMTSFEAGAAGVPGLAASSYVSVAPGGSIEIDFQPGNPCVLTVQALFADGYKNRGPVDFCKAHKLTLHD
ncbi:hypothetical protein [Oryzibacter oryziterrae]|uniref:hypothetical protein n=1 Tax=Oryzibacter oryziterrae TaxID=2766474 RepID=UPI001F382F64|nr:hypothetical protein [Oryzibacter oryziterrae]